MVAEGGRNWRGDCLISEHPVRREVTLMGLGGTPCLVGSYFGGTEMGQSPTAAGGGAKLNRPFSI